MHEYLSRVETLKGIAANAPGPQPAQVAPAAPAAPAALTVGCSLTQKGMAKIKEATLMDQRVTSSGSTAPGRYDQAIMTYMAGLDCCILALKRECTMCPSWSMVCPHTGSAFACSPPQSPCLRTRACRRREKRTGRADSQGKGARMHNSRGDAQGRQRSRGYARARARA